MLMPVNISDLRPGMRIARDVAFRGSILAGEGVIVDDQLIEMLQARGIEEVIVASEDEPQVDEDTAKVSALIERSRGTLSPRATQTLTKAMSRLDLLFRGYETDPVMAKLKAAGLRFWHDHASKIDRQERGIG